MKKTAIFGGTFNPPHMAHQRLIEAVLAENIVDDILVIPTKTPPHKNCDFLASEYHRFNMCKIAFSGLNNVQVSDIEFKREGKSYTYDTVMQLKEINPAKYFFICGADMVNTFDKWYNAELLIKEIGIIAFNRGGMNSKDFSCSIEKLRKKGAQIYVVDFPPLEVSSTIIRNGGQEVEKFLSPNVAEYIKENKLYGW